MSTTMAATGQQGLEATAAQNTAAAAFISDTFLEATFLCQEVLCRHPCSTAAHNKEINQRQWA